MESQLILLSAILTPSELRAAGAMSSEASRGRSPASFRSSAPRGSAFDPPSSSTGPPPPRTHPGDRPTADSRLALSRLLLWATGGVGAGAPATGSRQLRATDPRARNAVCFSEGPAGSRAGSGAGLGEPGRGRTPLPPPKALPAPRILQFCPPMQTPLLFPEDTADPCPRGAVAARRPASPPPGSLSRGVLSRPSARRPALPRVWRAARGENAASSRRSPWWPWR